MFELQIRIFSVVLFIAYRFINPTDAKDKAFLDAHRKWLDELAGLTNE